MIHKKHKTKYCPYKSSHVREKLINFVERSLILSWSAWLKKEHPGIMIAEYRVWCISKGLGYMNALLYSCWSERKQTLVSLYLKILNICIKIDPISLTKTSIIRIFKIIVKILYFPWIDKWIDIEQPNHNFTKLCKKIVYYSCICTRYWIVVYTSTLTYSYLKWMYVICSKFTFNSCWKVLWRANSCTSTHQIKILL